MEINKGDIEVLDGVVKMDIYGAEKCGLLKVVRESIEKFQAGSETVKVEFSKEMKAFIKEKLDNSTVMILYKKL